VTRSWITPEQANEVKRLWETYQDATLKAGAALGRYGTDPSAPETARMEDLRASNAFRRIREIYGDEATAIPSANKPFGIK
jgi:hypothetical protein